MARFFGADVIARVQEVLVAEMPAMIALIQTERSDPEFKAPTKYNIGYLERQFPECLISMDNSEVEMSQISMDIGNTPEQYPAEVVVVSKDITDKAYLRQEYYIEALQRVLHGYNDEDITWIVVTGTIRANMYTEQKETLRVTGVSITARIL
jgi:hypothetical protein